MDELSQLEKRLAAAERRVAEAGKLVALQGELVAKLESDGRDATTARKLLVSFAQSLAQVVGERDRIIRERERVARRGTR
ncbi:hypothetical protein QN219_29815 [Sinorhizobium sp. 7-81]|uniref:hypothetical protein n=1 Tax=Sinorhizobium sp. 8-89 TaxID=3049089 RepID=UPI0024C46888|nr:hypothetical protein [Sinorhizobium sp. 8-89]MDK1494168.1 hypothetical protein [Sinorhizobium sp. 8-89]